MGFYKKKPVVIEAMEVTSAFVFQAAKWCHGNVKWPSEQQPVIVISTLEGDMTASVGDYIIKGVKGEFYPCKPDIFEATYEECDESR